MGNAADDRLHERSRSVTDENVDFPRFLIHGTRAEGFRRFISRRELEILRDQDVCFLLDQGVVLLEDFSVRIMTAEEMLEFVLRRKS
jgi:hypothetical protein